MSPLLSVEWRRWRKQNGFALLVTAGPAQMPEKTTRATGYNVAARNKRRRRLEDKQKRDTEELEDWFAKFDAK